MARLLRFYPFKIMTSRPDILRLRMLLRLGLTVLTAAVALPASGDAQLRMTVWRADSGQVYQVLQHRAGENLGVGIDEVRVTSVSANSFASTACASPPQSAAGGARHALEAVASGPIGGARPIDLAYKSSLIADASAPCFSSGAVDGLGSVCIGPDCTAACECGDDDACETFTMTDGTPLTQSTPETPAAHVIAPMQVNQVYCDVANALAYGFGEALVLTTQSEICGAAPADGLRLVNTPSAFAQGRAGTTIVLTYAAEADESLAVSAAGFGIDNDGQNPFDCDSPGRVVAAVQASGDESPSETPPLPVELDPTERRCQQAIGRSGRRFAGRVLRALQTCRDRILSGVWPIQPDQCLSHPPVAKAVASAAKVSRSGLAARCRGLDLSRLLTCGDRVDDLFTPDYAGGCLFDTHLNLANQMAILQYGF